MNLIINPSQPPGYTRPINNGSTRFALPIPGHSRLKPELEKTGLKPLTEALHIRRPFLRFASRNHLFRHVFVRLDSARGTPTLPHVVRVAVAMAGAAKLIDATGRRRSFATAIVFGTTCVHKSLAQDRKLLSCLPAYSRRLGFCDKVAPRRSCYLAYIERSYYFYGNTFIAAPPYLRSNETPCGFPVLYIA
jgi:hypothetical protein